MVFNNVLNSMKLKMLLPLTVILLAACNLPSPAAPTITATPSTAPSTPENRTGMIIRGHVTLNGRGLEGVKIYKRFSAYPRDLIAITDENGYYESDFIDIPGDEMVSVEAELAGYTFEPPFYYWRHYHSFEDTTCDFVATAAP